MKYIYIIYKDGVIPQMTNSAKKPLAEYLIRSKDSFQNKEDFLIILC